MSYRVLILDDDEDFNNLLTDVFRQANYDVRSIISPREALRVFEKEVFDIVVTDQRMPELKGNEFIRRVFSLRRDTPVIVISGYLDNETVRDLIQQGVGGIFVKPLNVFSLLRKTGELIEQSRAGSPLPPGHRPDDPRSKIHERASPLSFPFQAYACRGPRIENFAKQVYEVRNFKSNIVLIGGTGSDFAAVARDLRDLGDTDNRRETLVELDNVTLGDPGLPDRLAAMEREGSEAFLLLYTETETMDADAIRLVFALARREGSFSVLNVPVRCIFCVYHELDELYDLERIDETLYLFIGTNELRLPLLREIPEEIGPLAERYLNEELGIDVTLQPDALQFLGQQKWPGNEAQLRAVVSRAARANPETPLDPISLEFSYGEGAVLAARGNPLDLNLHDYLVEARNHYLGALIGLSSRSASEISRELGIPISWFDSVRESAMSTGAEQSQREPANN